MAETDTIREPAPGDRLSTRIVATGLIALIIGLAMIGWTLWISWQLEGAAAAINDTGSLRMRANLIGMELLQARHMPDQEIRQNLLEQEATLQRLSNGVPSRPLFLPQNKEIHTQFRQVRTLWQTRMQAAIDIALSGGERQSYIAALPSFVDKADQLVNMIEKDNADKISLLRLSQSILIVIACVGTLTMIYLLYLWIILPVLRLQDGITHMASREFSVRLPVETRDEFGVLTSGFNRMAAELERLYRELEERVEQKTRLLAVQNQELETLYDMTVFLNRSNDIETLCRGFLQRICRQFDADGGSIRTLDPEGEKLLLIVAEGMTSELEESEHCMKPRDCYCGKATQQGTITIHDFHQLPQTHAYRCSEDGFVGLAVFRILSGDAVFGTFSLHFRQPRAMTSAEIQLLETLGRHLGVAMENRRFAAKTQQLAVAQERNLVAQGLHDSIAQGLNFLNLQVQLLDDAIVRGQHAEVATIIPLLKTGVEESYQDVRELLSNFRSKLEQGELVTGIEETVARFKRQTEIGVGLHIRDEGPPLPPEQQLQVLFILQEALSNVRKHANAGNVTIDVLNERDFIMIIRDDGQGYDPGEVAQSDQAHVGLTIMQERAARISAGLVVTALPGAGVTIRLHLANERRHAA